MIGVVVPAHDEEACLGACLAALSAAARHPALRGEAVRIVIVLDACADGSRGVVERHAAVQPEGDHDDGARAIRLRGAEVALDCIEIDARNVGAARAAGAERLLALGARWLAFTDADTLVSPSWLAAQLDLHARAGAEVVCGSIAVDDWSPHRQHAERLRSHFALTYDDSDGHRHIHGANLGVAAPAYRRAGGFAPLACHEDVALVAALERTGARFAWSAAPRVVTSARLDARARGGFGDTLLGVVAAAG